MAKPFDVRVSAPVTVAELRSRLLDPTALRAAALTAGALSVTVSVADEQTTITRTFAVPDQARLLVKASTVDLVEQRYWQGDGATIDITVSGLAVHVTGRVALLADDSACVVHASGDIAARMGFAGQFVESFIRDHIAHALEHELDQLSRA